MSTRHDLRPAMARRLQCRAVASGSIRLPAVPALLDDIQAQCERTFTALGIDFTAEQQSHLRSVLAGQLEAAYAASPRAELVFTYEVPVGFSVTYKVTVAIPSLGETYDRWVGSRQPPYFGVAPDARVMALAMEAASPDDCPVLDIGAGTGRNALALARRGHPVDAIELSSAFATILREAAARAVLPIRLIERDVFSHREGLRDGSGLVLLSEVVSDFRSTLELRQMFEIAAEHLAPGGRLLFNVFLPQPGYDPDAAARELGLQVYTAIFTYAEIASAVAGLPLTLVGDDSVYDYEREHLPEGAWPPTYWYPDWVCGLDVFDVPRDDSPITMRWLVWLKESEA